MTSKIVLSEQEMMSTGNKIKELREKSGWTQQQLADLAEVSKNTVNNIETGKTASDMKTLKAIAKALGVKVITLLDEEHEPSEDEELEVVMEAVKSFTPTERETVIRVLEAMNLKHQTEKLLKKTSD